MLVDADLEDRGSAVDSTSKRTPHSVLRVSSDIPFINADMMACMFKCLPGLECIFVRFSHVLFH